MDNAQQSSAFATKAVNWVDSSIEPVKSNKPQTNPPNNPVAVTSTRNGLTHNVVTLTKRSTCKIHPFYATIAIRCLVSERVSHLVHVFSFCRLSWFQRKKGGQKVQVIRIWITKLCKACEDDGPSLESDGSVQTDRVTKNTKEDPDSQVLLYDVPPVVIMEYQTLGNPSEITGNIITNSRKTASSLWKGIAGKISQWTVHDANRHDKGSKANCSIIAKRSIVAVAPWIW